MLQSPEQVQDVASLDATNLGGLAVLEMRELLRQLYRTYQNGPPQHYHGQASLFREHVAAI